MNQESTSINYSLALKNFSPTVVEDQCASPGGGIICGEMMKKAIRYALGEWKEMKRVLESGDVELTNNLREQMMRSIKMKRTVEDHLMSLLDKLKLSREGDDLTDLLPCNLAT